MANNSKLENPSKRESYYTVNGFARYTKIHDVKDIDNLDLQTPTSTFIVKRDFPRQGRQTKDEHKFIKKDKVLSVIGRPTSPNDKNEYVLFHEDIGVLRKPWCQISEYLTFVSFETKVFSVTTEGTYKEKENNSKSTVSKCAYKIPLPKDRHVWILKEWLDKANFNHVYYEVIEAAAGEHDKEVEEENQVTADISEAIPENSNNSNNSNNFIPHPYYQQQQQEAMNVQEPQPQPQAQQFQFQFQQPANTFLNRNMGQSQNMNFLQRVEGLQLNKLMKVIHNYNFFHNCVFNADEFPDYLRGKTSFSRMLN